MKRVPSIMAALALAVGLTWGALECTGCNPEQESDELTLLGACEVVAAAWLDAECWCYADLNDECFSSNLFLDALWLCTEEIDEGDYDDSIGETDMLDCLSSMYGAGAYCDYEEGEAPNEWGECDWFIDAIGI